MSRIQAASRDGIERNGPGRAQAARARAVERSRPGEVAVPDTPGPRPATASWQSRTHVLRASPPMFESRLLDACSRVHPSVPVLVFVPAIAVLTALSLGRVSLGAFFGLLAGGYVMWTLFEYWLHRLVFHFEPERGIGARLHWIIHGVHHDHPNDPMRLVMPPAVSVPLAAIILAILYLAFGRGYAPGLGAGFYAGYLLYDMTHYYLHHFTPRGALGRLLRELHMRHHFQDDARGFGISAPYWDLVFGTLARRSPGATGDPPTKATTSGR